MSLPIVFELFDVQLQARRNADGAQRLRWGVAGRCSAERVLAKLRALVSMVSYGNNYSSREDVGLSRGS
eukprot:6180213-Pleurochrysis_carterae.AAC.7